LVIGIAAMFIKPAADFVPAADGPQYSNADIAWVLVTALVFLMTSVCLLYGGMVNRKNVILLQ
jgi:Amt family ammonium transporter